MYKKYNARVVLKVEVFVDVEAWDKTQAVDDAYEKAMEEMMSGNVFDGGVDLTEVYDDD